MFSKYFKFNFFCMDKSNGRKGCIITTCCYGEETYFEWKVFFLPHPKWKTQKTKGTTHDECKNSNQWCKVVSLKKNSNVKCKKNQTHWMNNSQVHLPGNSIQVAMRCTTTQEAISIQDPVSHSQLQTHSLLPHVYLQTGQGILLNIMQRQANTTAQLVYGGTGLHYFLL